MVSGTGTGLVVVDRCFPISELVCDHIAEAQEIVCHFRQTTITIYKLHAILMAIIYFWCEFHNIFISGKSNEPEHVSKRPGTRRADVTV